MHLSEDTIMKGVQRCSSTTVDFHDESTYRDQARAKEWLCIDYNE